jgi:hypothetical protein
MPRFAYSALDQEGIERKGQLEAASLDDALQNLRQQGLFVASLQMVSAEAATGRECPYCSRPLPEQAERCDACGAWVAGQTRVTAATAGLGEPAPSALDFEDLLAKLVREGKKIQAIKQYRDATGAGLKEAKEYVEWLAARRGISVRCGSGCATTTAALLALGVWCVAQWLA